MGGTWLSERELALVDWAEKLSIDLPIPTQIVSNGEYLPPKQSNVQKKVEDLTKKLERKNRGTKKQIAANIDSKEF